MSKRVIQITFKDDIKTMREKFKQFLDDKFGDDELSKQAYIDRMNINSIYGSIGEKQYESFKR